MRDTVILRTFHLVSDRSSVRELSMVFVLVFNIQSNIFRCNYKHDGSLPLLQVMRRNTIPTHQCENGKVVPQEQHPLGGSSVQS